MKVAVLLIVVIGQVYARPDIGIDRKYELSQDVPSQQLSIDSDTVSVPCMRLLSGQVENNVGRNKYREGAMIPVELVYESKVDDTTSGMERRFALATYSDTRKPLKSSSNRQGRSRIFLNDFAINNYIPGSDYNKASENPTVEMYNDNFGGKHDSQDGKFSDDLKERQQLGYFADVSNRAIIESRNFAGKELSISQSNMAQMSSEDQQNENKRRSVMRKFQHDQTVMLPSGLFDLVNTGHDMPFSQKVHSFQQNPRHSRSSLASHPEADYRINSNAKFRMPLPYSNVWSSTISVLEYEPSENVASLSSKTAARKKRDTLRKQKKKPQFTQEQVPERKENPQKSVFHQFVAEDLPRSGAGGPKIWKLRVRKGGVAIAGPGGVATAGSGGTAIVGPGGTAYTTRDGTAVVGPGGRVIEIPYNFFPTKIESRNNDPRHIFVPPGGKILAHGPFVYTGRTEGAPLSMTPIIEKL